MLLGLVLFGLFSVILGVWLFAKWMRSRGALKTIGLRAYIAGAVGFILIAVGLVLIGLGMTIPFSV